MKSQIFSKLQSSPRLTRKDLFLTLIPALLWLGAVSARDHLIQTRCSDSPTACPAASVNLLDQPSLGLEHSGADGYSYYTQNFSGVLAFSTPILWNGALALAGKISPVLALTQSAIDLVIIGQTALWNGLATESAHLLSQRPRPFVYTRTEEGKNPASYTSFYSGHTSFAATSNTALWLTLLGRNAPTPALVVLAALAQLLILSTGVFRVLAGRHFVTDVLTGAVMGSLIALAIAYYHRKNPPTEG